MDDARVGALRRRVVELGQVDAGEDQQLEADQGDPAQRVGERVGVLGNRVAERADPEAVVKPASDPGARAAGNRRSTPPLSPLRLQRRLRVGRTP